MAGIYLHIPFCKQACHYCDFHFSTVMKNKTELLEAMHREIDLRSGYLEGELIETIYFGGGTPSLLTTDELNRLLDAIMKRHQVSPDAEITLEANPDDLDRDKIRNLASGPVNRLSIGIQSFREEDLKLMNRAHTAQQADYAVKASQDAGFENITIDLIYSIPGLSDLDWKDNLNKAVALDVQHISAYSLTIEPKTVFGNYQKRGKLKAVEQEVSMDQFLTMTDVLRQEGFEQYEVSNFSKPTFESRHNTSYWKGKRYLGIGPSAHSFNLISRQWNIANNNAYIRSLQEGQLNAEVEILDDRTRLNEYIMTGLRTKWGIDIDFIQDKFGLNLSSMYEDMIHEYTRKGLMTREGTRLVLTTEGFLLADRIASDMFVINEEQ